MKETWKTVSGLEARGVEITRKFGVSSTAAAFLAARGGDDDEIDLFLHCDEMDWPEPARLPNIEEAAGKIAQAVRSNKKILVHGDYDVDGLMGAAIWIGALRAFGAKVDVYIPSRFEGGYGFSEESFRAVMEAGAGLVVTTDCGTNCGETGDRLLSKGVDMVVTDHHLPVPGRQPRCAIVNAHLVEEHPDADLCGAAVAVQCALRTASLLKTQLPLEPFVRLAAIATVSDVAEITPKNRMICRRGFRTLRDGPNEALSMMFRKARPNEDGPVRSRDVAYHVAPRFNAPGRLGDSSIVLELLMERDTAKASALLGTLEGMNTKRRKLQNAILDEAETQAMSLKERRAIVVGSNGWHQGVMGPVASRLAETHHAPVFAAAFTDGVGKGSARSWGGVDVAALLSEAEDLLITFGGHRSAAGFTVRRDRLSDLRKRLNDSAIMDSVGEKGARSRNFFLVEQERLEEAWEALGLMDPFGPGNEEPFIGVEGLKLVSCRTVGDNHLIWKVRRPGGGDMSVIAWGGLSRGLTESSLGDSSVVVGRLVPETWFRGIPFYLSVEAIL